MEDQYLLDALKNHLVNEGRLRVYPSKRKYKILSLFFLASKFEKGKVYTEKEVNQILLNWHSFNDWAILRRDLYDNYFLGRKSDCSSYWLEDIQPTLESFGV